MSSVAINLLPDLRQAKQRSASRRQLFTGIAIVTWIACVAVIAILLFVIGGEKFAIKTMTDSINRHKAELDANTTLIPALTAQQNLAALPNLFTQRVYLTNFFRTYQQSAPSDVKLNAVTIDAQNELVVSGSANSYASVATLARAMEERPTTNGQAFTNVWIDSASLSGVGNTITFSVKATVSQDVTSQGASGGSK